jgi:hypothetical protein
VLDLPLSASFTSLHDLFHSTAFVVARNAANACRATAKRSDAALTAEARTIALVDDGISLVPQAESRAAVA